MLWESNNKDDRGKVGLNFFVQQIFAQYCVILTGVKHRYDRSLSQCFWLPKQRVCLGTISKLQNSIAFQQQELGA